MGWGQITISLDGCVHVVRFFNRASINRFFFILDTVGSAFFPCIDTADILVVEPLYTF
jgi:hypothetical protein